MQKVNEERRIRDVGLIYSSYEKHSERSASDYLARSCRVCTLVAISPHPSTMARETRVTVQDVCIFLLNIG
jgi:hypothetical protein